MGIIAPTVDVNGHEFSRTSVVLKVDAIELRLFKSVHWNSKLTPGVSWGNKAKPRARTRGKFEPTADLELYEVDWTVLRDYLAGLDPRRGVMEQSFTLTVTAHEPTLGTTTAQIIGCRITEVDRASADGDDEASRKITLSVMDIVEDGASMVREATATGI